MTESTSPSQGYADLLHLFEDFREFQQPPLENGVPDYSRDAMAEQERRLPEFRARLEAIDASAWTVPEQVDRALVGAEMNGLEFDHRVLRPWERDPSFYCAVQMGEYDVPAKEAPCMHGSLEMWAYDMPLGEGEREHVRERLASVPETLARAKRILTAPTKDLHRVAIHEKAGEIHGVERLAALLREHHPDLAPLAEKAGAALVDFQAWLVDRHASLAESRDGVGVDEFDWSMRHVHLVPYSWQEQEAMIRRELERAWTAMRLEEHRNRKLLPLTLPESVEEMGDRVDAAYADFMRFLREEEVFTVADYMRLSRPRPKGLAAPEHLDIFTEVEYRHLLPLRCHMIHWLEKQREAHNRHPIRSRPLLYNIWDSRAEGFATAFEETMLQAGLMDDAPRARELVYVLLAFRAARALGGMHLHARDWTFEEAIEASVAGTPRSWLRPGGGTILGDLGIYLRQPGYGTSYVVGKIQYEKTLAEWSMQQGDAFTLRAFFDDYFARGMIPASLLRWEMTGRDEEVRALGVI